MFRKSSHSEFLLHKGVDYVKVVFYGGELVGDGEKEAGPCSGTKIGPVPVTIANLCGPRCLPDVGVTATNIVNRQFRAFWEGGSLPRPPKKTRNLMNVRYFRWPFSSPHRWSGRFIEIWEIVRFGRTCNQYFGLNNLYMDFAIHRIIATRIIDDW